MKSLDFYSASSAALAFASITATSCAPAAFNFSSALAEICL